MQANALIVRSLKIRYARDMAIWVLVFVVGVAWWWLAVIPAPVPPPLMVIRGLVTNSGPFCPGDTLTYTIRLDVAEPGVYAIDASVWRTTPPATALFSEVRRFVASEPASYRIDREWVIPATYLDPTTNQPIAWLPGRYERRHAISTVSRATKPSITVLPFEIAAGCK